MNNMMDQFEKFIESEKTQPIEATPVAETVEYVDNVIYVDFQARCRIYLFE